MDKLYPIVRRVRRPLLPPEEAAPAVQPAVVELPPPAPLVESIASAPGEVAPPIESNQKRTECDASSPA